MFRSCHTTYQYNLIGRSSVCLSSSRTLFNHSPSHAMAIDQNSASALLMERTICFLLLQVTKFSHTSVPYPDADLLSVTDPAQSASVYTSTPLAWLFLKNKPFLEFPLDIEEYKIQPQDVPHAWHAWTGLPYSQQKLYMVKCETNKSTSQLIFDIPVSTETPYFTSPSFKVVSNGVWAGLHPLIPVSSKRKCTCDETPLFIFLIEGSPFPESTIIVPYLLFQIIWLNSSLVWLVLQHHLFQNDIININNQYGDCFVRYLRK